MSFWLIELDTGMREHCSGILWELMLKNCVSRSDTAYFRFVELSVSRKAVTLFSFKI